MIANLLIGILIFGYAGWTIMRFVRKSKQGKCAVCSLNKRCNSVCNDPQSQGPKTFA
ncbi:flagellar biogenesis protein FliO [Croceifilum oryzae]|uniref:Flagellar biogenesis protein FliO n=1 Tax=Croceifilum oryzae TaxID=1553429 RepID=A0AAJ1TI57_9BACL|nr:FeoB-associated Cys-rich membrane protein [Croceifilum oryzae]MDQ0417382.1 flagellar biogenesis protein FliO [Croceifilum oryzae]